MDESTASTENCIDAYLKFRRSRKFKVPREDLFVGKKYHLQSRANKQYEELQWLGYQFLTDT